MIVIRRCISDQRPFAQAKRGFFAFIAGSSMMLLLACGRHETANTPAIPVATSTALPIGMTLPVTNCAQEADLLCWAACGQMVMDFWKTAVSQCAQVERRSGDRGCCDNHGRSLCNQSGWPQFPEWGFHCQTTTVALTWAQLQTQIVKSQAFVFSWMTVIQLSDQTVTGGHMMVARGYTNLDEEAFVVIHDPARSDLGLFTYDEFVAPTNYVHWRDIYNIAKR
jgi:hypothetical protein